MRSHAVRIWIVVAASILAQAVARGDAAGDEFWTFLFEFGTGARDIAVDSHGDVYLLHEHAVDVFTPEGRFLRGTNGFLTGMGIAIDENDVVYIQEKCAVHLYTTDLVPLRGWDTCLGQGDLQAASAVDAQDGLVYVATSNGTLKFTTEGVLLNHLHGVGGEHIELVPDGSFWFAWSFSGEGFVTHYTPEGQVLAEWSTILEGEEESSPHGIVVDSLGRIFVSDEGARVKIFRADGTLDHLIQWQLRFFWAVELDGDDTLYVGGGFPDHVMKFRRELIPVEPATWGRIKSHHR